MKISRNLKAGIIYCNHWLGPQNSTPFGGFKQSGIGRELGKASLDAYQESTSILIANPNGV